MAAREDAPPGIPKPYAHPKRSTQTPALEVAPDHSLVFHVIGTRLQEVELGRGRREGGRQHLGLRVWGQIRNNDLWYLPQELVLLLLKKTRRQQRNLKEPK